MLRLSVPFDERRAQRAVATRQLLPRFPHRCGIVGPGDRDHVHDVVDGTPWGQLVEEPELLLREGKRHRPVHFPAPDPLYRRRSGPARFCEDLRERTEGRVLEQRPGLEVDCKHVPDARHRLDREQ